jgi:predicted DNA binding CopG/RHH family protein
VNNGTSLHIQSWVFPDDGLDRSLGRDPHYHCLRFFGRRRGSVLERERSVKRKMAKKRVVPKFASEAEEASWWDKNRKMISRDVRDAAGTRELKILTNERLRERLTARPVTIRLAEADIKLARKQAERKGLPYQTYIKSLLHETLVERENMRR